MTETTVAPPHDLDAERGLLGYLLLHPERAGEVLSSIRPEDCYSPAHLSILAAIETLHQDGIGWDTKTVHTEAIRSGVAPTLADLVSWQAEAPIRWEAAVEWLVELRARRDLLGLADVLECSARDMACDPADAIDIATSALASVTTSGDAAWPAGMHRSSDIARASDAQVEWVVPGLLGRLHRAVIVGFEGHGKTAALAQVGWCASQGLHPFNRRPIPPVRVLHVDLENPEDRIRAGYRPLLDLCEQQSRCFDEDRHFTLQRPGGMNLRTRKDRNALEQALRMFSPDLVCIGPLRKSYQPDRGENDERAALAVQAVFDDLRTRYDFAMLIEAHAPHGDSISTQRKARPMGSSTWLGWSEFGYGMQLVRDRPGVYELERWRMDRVQASWPAELHRGSIAGSPWFWDGYWPNGEKAL